MHLLKKYHKAVLILAIAAGLMAWIFGNAPVAQKSLKTVKIAKIPFVEVQIKSQPIPVASRGKVYASQIRQITSEVPGLVTHVSSSLIKGAMVKKDDLLIQLDQQPFILDIAQKKANVDQAKLQLQRTKATAKVAQKGVSKNASEYARHIPQLQQANSQVEAALAALEYAKNQLNKASIKSPIDGKVIHLNITEGEYIRATSHIAKIYGTEMVEVRLPLNDRQIDILGINYDDSQIYSGPNFNPQVKLNSYQDKQNSWFGHITRIEGERDSNQLLYVIAQISSQNNTPSGKPLLPGSFIEASISGKVIHDLRILPRKAEQSSNKIWVIDNENRLKSQKIDVIYRGKKHIYFRSDLKPNTRIASGAFHLMSEGLLVTPWNTSHSSKQQEATTNNPLLSAVE